MHLTCCFLVGPFGQILPEVSKPQFSELKRNYRGYCEIVGPACSRKKICWWPKGVDAPNGHSNGLLKKEAFNIVSQLTDQI